MVNLFYGELYFFKRTQCIKYDGLCSDIFIVHKRVPKSTVLGPLLFIIYINALDLNVKDANLYFCANNTSMYCC